jgi:hypothetical protein
LLVRIKKLRPLIPKVEQVWSSNKAVDLSWEHPSSYFQSSFLFWLFDFCWTVDACWCACFCLIFSLFLWSACDLSWETKVFVLISDSMSTSFFHLYTYVFFSNLFHFSKILLVVMNELCCLFSRDWMFLNFPVYQTISFFNTRHYLLSKFGFLCVFHILPFFLLLLSVCFLRPQHN